MLVWLTLHEQSLLGKLQKFKDCTISSSWNNHKETRLLKKIDQSKVLCINYSRLHSCLIEIWPTNFDPTWKRTTHAKWYATQQRTQCKTKLTNQVHAVANHFISLKHSNLRTSLLSSSLQSRMQFCLENRKMIDALLIMIIKITISFEIILCCIYKRFKKILKITLSFQIILCCI